MEPEILNFGCMHYRRRCKIRVPCCDEVFDCRHCHNEAKKTHIFNVSLLLRPFLVINVIEYSCPVCSKSVCDMSSVWNKLEELIASTPMPETYKNKMVWILCNDCGVNSHVQFQIMA
ncbi:E3 ubiquitin-protein ligase RZFP34 [Glycine soja]